jgi:hypothetical protein
VYEYSFVFENKSVFNLTFCQLLMEKPNCMKIITQELRFLKFYSMASGSSTVVEHLPHPPKVKGSRPVIATGTGRKKWQKSFHQESFIRLPMESFIC